MKKRKILFVCMANLNRSPSFEVRAKQRLPKDEYEIRSAGIHYGYPHQVNKEILEWADEIYLMDLEQEIFIKDHYPDPLIIKKLHMIGVSDQYDREAPQLMDVIDYWFDNHWRKENE